MGVLDKIFSNAAADVTKSIGDVIGNLSTTDDEKLKAKNELTQIVLDNLTKLAALQAEVLKVELQGNWLQRSWRPIMMLVFMIIVAAKWFGYTDANISDQLELELMGIIKLGIGGYVIGRTAEQITKSVTQNVDLPFIKKKNREL